MWPFESNNVKQHRYQSKHLESSKWAVHLPFSCSANGIKELAVAAQISFLMSVHYRALRGGPGPTGACPVPLIPLIPSHRRTRPLSDPLLSRLISPSPILKQGLAHYEGGKPLSCPPIAAGVKLMCQLPFGAVEKGGCLSPVVFLPQGFLCLSPSLCVSFLELPLQPHAESFPSFCSFHFQQPKKTTHGDSHNSPASHTDSSAAEGFQIHSAFMFDE